MDVLIKYGFSIDEIKNMMDTNIEIENVNDSLIYELIDILGKYGCMNTHIKNIFITNPFVLTKKIIDIKEILYEMEKLGFDNIYLLLDSNPYILNQDKNEIKKIFEKYKNQGMTNKQIIDNFYLKAQELI